VYVIRNLLKEEQQTLENNLKIDNWYFILPAKIGFDFTSSIAGNQQHRIKYLCKSIHIYFVHIDTSNKFKAMASSCDFFFCWNGVGYI
jgi:hypothetical protein